jgi:dihydroneopterin aldolase
VTDGPGRVDRIEIRGLRLVATHGALPEERERPQPFELDIDVSLANPPEADLLEDTLDYGTLVSVVAEVTRGSSFILLESLAAAVAQRLIDFDPRALRAEVVVRKLRPPIPFDIGSVGVRVVRDRRPGEVTG